MQTLNNADIRRCYEFAEVAWNNRSQSVQQFGTTEQRTRESFIADQVSGKLAELIFKKEIENKFHGVNVYVDFEHYLNPLHTDDGDVSMDINGESFPLRIDIKASSHKAQWLLVEQHKFQDLKTNIPMADRYVMVKFCESIPTSDELRDDPTIILDLPYINGKIEGWAIHRDFISLSDNAPWFTFHRKDRLITSRVLPMNSGKVNDINHLKNYINKVKQSKEIENIYIGKKLDAILNVGLPIKWLKKEVEGLLKI